MSHDTVLCEMHGDVALITLNRPDSLNSLSEAVFADFDHALDVAALHRARCIVLTGNGRAFCSGADLREDRADRNLGNAIDRQYNPMVRRVAALEVPFLTAVNGPAVGAGCGLALLGDIVVMARSAYLQLAFANIGLVPDAGSSWLLGKSAGRAKALDLALTGDRLSAEDAQGAGIVSRVVDDTQCLPHALELAAKLAAGPTVALGLIRRQVPAELSLTLDEALDLERDNQKVAGYTEDFAEAVAAFRDKRLPVFRGQ